MRGERQESDLPGPHPKLLEISEELLANPPQTREAAVDQRLRFFGSLAGSLAPADDTRARALYEREQRVVG